MKARGAEVAVVIITAHSTLQNAVAAMQRGALERLATHDWPGKVRELENAIKRALVLASGEILVPEDFSLLDEKPPRGIREADLNSLLRVEAALLGINRNTLRKKIAALGIELPGRD